MQNNIQVKVLFNHTSFGRIMIIFFLLAVGNVDGQQMEGYKYSPNYYNCVYIAKSADITIDGDLSEKAWEKADWSSLFVDIENSARPAPYLDTRVKMLWDDAYLYIAAEIMESHLWATYSKQDMEISQENSFQVFIDPEGNTHNYLEIQINTLGAVLDVFHQTIPR
ncbi:MAG: carbohydrate-binding family 9-like protein [Saprospiraceae bacterium]|nr:carbohydrate-binding family 9-like protein [Saprospiraceae bacterium]